MTEQLTAAAKTVGQEMIETIRQNPDKLYFPFFGSGDNILKNGFTINRVMFTIPGTDFQIYWYGFLIALGIILAMVYGFKKMKTVGIDPDRATDAIIGGIIGAIIGARLYYVIFSLSDYTTAAGKLDFKEMINVRDGGLAVYGGLIGAVIVGGIVAKIRKLKLTPLLDIVGPGFLIGQAIGRWGNFFNMEAFGSNTTLPWGMMSNATIEYLAANYDTIAANTGEVVDVYMPVHPCFLYESLWCILGFVLLNLYLKHRKFDGEVFLMYIGWYGLGRFFIEGLRTDSLYFGKIRVSQLVAGTCVLAAVLLIIIFRGIIRRSGDYKFYYQTDESVAQLAEYVAYEEIKAKQKEIKAKIKEAGENGESVAELKKQLEELKKSAAENIKKDRSGDDRPEKEEEYKNIIDEDEPEDEEAKTSESDDESVNSSDESFEAENDDDSSEEEQ